MSILDRVHRQQSVKTGSFRLTESGREKLQDGFGGDSNGRTLLSLECMGSSGTLEDISRDTGIPQGKLEHILPALMKQGYISSSSEGSLL